MVPSINVEYTGQIFTQILYWFQVWYKLYNNIVYISLFYEMNILIVVCSMSSLSCFILLFAVSELYIQESNSAEFMGKISDTFYQGGNQLLP